MADIADMLQAHLGYPYSYNDPSLGAMYNPQGHVDQTTALFHYLNSIGGMQGGNNPMHGLWGTPQQPAIPYSALSSPMQIDPEILKILQGVGKGTKK